MVLVWGLISDKLGRRWVYVLGFIIAAGGLYLFTFATQVYPDLLLYRLVFAVGAAGCSAMLTAVLADYAGEKDRGKMAGLVGLCSGLGALVALFVFLPLVTTLSGGGLPGLRTTYLLVATITIGAAILLFFTLAPHTIPVAQPFIQEESSHVEDGCLPAAPMATLRPSVESQMTWGQSAYSVIQLAQDGLMAGKDPKIILGYFSAFLARGDSIILTIFIPLWVYKYYIDAGLCSAVGGVEDPDLKESCKKAYINASILSGVAQTLALVGAPFFGMSITVPTFTIVDFNSGLLSKDSCRINCTVH